MDFHAALRIATIASLAVLVLGVVARRYAGSEALRSAAAWVTLGAVYVALGSVLARLGLATQGAESALDAALPVVGIVGLSVLVIGWHVVSVSRSEATQSRTAWAATCALFLTLGTLFVHLVRQAREADSILLLALFGLLLGVFASGFAVSLVKTAGAFSRTRSGGDHATH